MRSGGAAARRPSRCLCALPGRSGRAPGPHTRGAGARRRDHAGTLDAGAARPHDLSGSHQAAAPLTARLGAAIALSAFAATAAGLTLVSAAAAPPNAPAKDPLADDARLAQKIRVSVEGLPVSDLLAQLAAKTGVALAAEPDIGDDKVIVFGPARPLRDLLADLAALFNDRWESKRTRDGEIRYRLYRTVAARQLEATFARRTTEQQMARLERLVSGLDMKPEELARPENRDIQWYAADRKRRFAVTLYRLLGPGAA